MRIVLVFPRKRKTPEFTKKGEIHALFVSAPFLVWFAGATPDFSIREVSNGVGADGVGVKFPMVFANCSLCSCAKDKSERKTKGQQLKGKIVSALFHIVSHVSTLSQHFSPRNFLEIEAFSKENQKKMTKPFCTLVVARLSSSEQRELASA